MALQDRVQTGSASRTGKPRLPRALRQDQILDVAQELFLGQGYEATSIEDICRAAEVSRPVVYEVIGNKQAIYLACVRRVRRVLDQALAKSAASTADPIQQLRLGANAWLELLENDPRILELLYGRAGAVGALSDELQRERSQTVETIIANLRAAAPDADPKRAEIYAHLISGAGEQLARWWLANRHVPREAIVEHEVDFIWGGVQRLLDDAGDAQPH
jgi:AcrR family transcriptional regulator